MVICILVFHLLQQQLDFLDLHQHRHHRHHHHRQIHIYPLQHHQHFTIFSRTISWICHKYSSTATITTICTIHQISTSSTILLGAVNCHTNSTPPPRSELKVESLPSMKCQSHSFHLVLDLPPPPAPTVTLWTMQEVVVQFYMNNTTGTTATTIIRFLTSTTGTYNQIVILR